MPKNLDIQSVLVLGAGPIQIDEVEALGPLIDPVAGHRGGVFREDGFPLVISLLEADAPATSQVDSRPDFHRFTLP